MTSVFIGGSRAVARLNGIVRDKLDDLITRRCRILVGDANGADKAVQQHFFERSYEHVIVYCMDHCRNNLGNWPTKHITRPGARKDFAYYAIKDLAMVEDAKCGMMLWDGRSKGTLNNVQRLLGEEKKTLVYFAPEMTFCRLNSERDLAALLQRCNPDDVRAAQQQIQAKIPSQLPFDVRQS